MLRGVRASFFEPVIPDGARIIVFHGRPNPPDAAAGQWLRRTKKSHRGLEAKVKLLRSWISPTRRVRPATWIDQHWK